MKKSEQLYNVVALIGSCAVLILALFQWLVLMPGASGAISDYLGFCISLELIWALLFGLSAVANLVSRELLLSATMLQIVLGFISGFFLPVGIWGVTLLILKSRRFAGRQGPEILEDGRVELRSRWPRMRLGELVYNAIILSLALVLIIFASMSYYFGVVSAQTEAGIYRFVMLDALFLGGLLGVMALIQFTRDEMLFSLTLMQIGGCVATIWFWPAAIWGMVLVALRLRREGRRPLSDIEVRFGCWPRMRAGEVFYNTAAWVGALFLVMAAIGLNFFVPMSSMTLCLTVSFILLLALGVGLAAILNFVRGQLIYVATIVQILSLAASIWLLPVAVWGILMLVAKSRRQARELGLRRPVGLDVA